MFKISTFFAVVLVMSHTVVYGAETEQLVAEETASAEGGNE